MGRSLSYDVLRSIMILIQCWPLTSMSNLHGFWHVFMSGCNFFCFDISFPYLAHGCITMRGCVVYIHDPDMMLTLDVKVKFIGFLTCQCVWLVNSVCFDIGLPYLAHECINTRQHVVYIHDLCMTLTFDLYVGGGGFLSEFYSQFLSCW